MNIYHIPGKSGLNVANMMLLIGGNTVLMQYVYMYMANLAFFGQYIVMRAYTCQIWPEYDRYATIGGNTIG